VLTPMTLSSATATSSDGSSSARRVTADLLQSVNGCGFMRQSESGRGVVPRKLTIADVRSFS